MPASANATAGRPMAGSRAVAKEGGGAKAARTICASLAVALGLCVLVSFVPDNPYQRWQLAPRPLFQTVPWIYERIHFDPRPIDVVVVGPSKTFNGVNMAEVERRLAERARTVSVANFSLPAEGRNVNWAILEETFKAKSPKVIVIGVDALSVEYGHPAFKDIASAEAIAVPPAFLLHDYFYDLVHLPARQVALLFARFFPGLAGLRDAFDPAIYARTKSDFSEGRYVLEGKTIDMDAEVPADVLLRRPLSDPAQATTATTRLLMRCCNEGDERVYLKQIVELARAHGARLIFAFMPDYDDTRPVAARAFLSQYGEILDNGDLSRNSALYYNRQHMNHAGAVIVSDRLAALIAEGGPPPGAAR